MTTIPTRTSRLRAVLRAWRPLLGVVAGAAGGAAYAHFVGCHGGSCPLTGNVWTAALFFGFTGGVILAPGPRPGGPGADPGRRG